MNFARKMTFAIALFVGAMAVSAQNFVLEGKVKGNVEGASVVLQKYESNDVSTFDSTVVKNGEFTFRSNVREPGNYQLVIDTNKPGTEMPDFQKMWATRIYLENTPMTFAIDLTDMQKGIEPDRIKATITGSATQDIFQKYLDLTDALSFQIDSLEGAADEAVDLQQRVAIAKQSQKLKAELRQKVNQFIQDNKGSLVAVDLVTEALMDLPCPYTEAQVDEMLGWLTADWNGKTSYINLQKQADFAKQIAVGKPFIDGVFVDKMGKKVKLSSLIKKGEYTMLEFWASWCHPCRQEIPHLKKVHERYKDFNIISISIDEREADWKKAMNKEGMTWTQLRNPESFGGVVADKYGITAIPACIILDKEGNFYKTNMRGADLDAFLYDYYKR